MKTFSRYRAAIVKPIVCTAALASVLSLSVGAQASSTIDISGQVNSPLAGYTNGGAYPTPGNVTIGGIGFALADIGGATSVVQSGFGFSTGPYTVNVGLANVTKVYSIVNSAVGAFGANIGSLTFQGANPLNSFTYTFTEGLNVRDHYNGVFNNIATGLFASQNYNTPGSGLNDVRFDVQRILLPLGFASDTLQSITFNGGGGGNGEPFLAALTADFGQVGGVPEPASWALMIAGFGLIGAAMRHRRERVRVTFA